MTWDSEFYQALDDDADFKGSVTSFFYAYNKEAQVPFASYQLVSATGTNDLSGHDPDGYRRVQLSIWAESPTQAEQSAKYAIKAAKSNLVVSEVFQQSLGRDESGAFGFVIDFLIWFDNP